MDASTITPYIDSTRDVFRTMLGLPVSCGCPVLVRKVGAGDADVSGIIGMSGDVRGTVVLAFPMATAIGVVSRFAACSPDPESDDFADAVGELVNMISGAAKAKFDGRIVSISCPSVILGRGHRIQQMSDSIAVRIPCESECGPFAVEVAIKVAIPAVAGVEARRLSA